MRSIPELLAPAGDLQKLQYAFAYGADAVYAGVPVFSLRARENGFRDALLAEAIAYAHKAGKKIYLTLNIYAHNSRVERALEAFCRFAEMEPDGFIMSDPGLIARARSLCPTAAIHLSTQANVCNYAAVQFWRDVGVERIILPRELSLDEIGEIHEKVPDIALECFVHGALCIAYSGRCLISNYLNHRRANEGTCTNSCRWEYGLSREAGSLAERELGMTSSELEYEALAERYYVTEPRRPNERFEMDEDEHGTYLMNSRDLCAIELLEQIRDAGISSVKIEGRTKSLYYLAVVTRAYRAALADLTAGKPFNPENLFEVMSTENRTLMTGFFLRNPRMYGENREDGVSQALTHRYAGRVVDHDSARQLAQVEVKNKLVVGDTIEWITPNKTFNDTVRVIESSAGEKLTEVHGGTTAALACPFVPDEWTMLRVAV